MSRETKIKIDIETSQTESSLKALREELKRVKDEMAGLEEGSDAFLQAAKKGGELQHQIQEINQSIRGASADFGDMLGNITNVGAGITGAFQAAKGAMELMGVESENVTKAIKDMQSIMAMTQGLDAIDNAIQRISSARSSFGAQSNRLDYTVNYNDYANYNLTAANSRIRDTEYGSAVIDKNRKQALQEYKLFAMKAQMNSNAGFLKLF